MKLLNGHRAVVEDGKLLDCIINLDHPVGRHHAILFERLLGITRLNAALLKSAIIEAAINADAAPGRFSPHGTKFEQRLMMRGHKGPVPVLAV